MKKQVIRISLTLISLFTAFIFWSFMPPGFGTFISASSAGDAPAQVSGIVIGPSYLDQPDQRYSPIEGASVTLKGNGIVLSTVTDNSGGFYFQMVQPGDYTLSVSKQGFSSYISRIKLNSGEVRRVDNVALIPGGGITSAMGVIVPDTVYVALARNEVNDNPNRTTLADLARLLYAKNPIVTPPEYSNPYEELQDISIYPDILMMIEPNNTSRVGYMKLEGSPTWLCFNPAGTKLFVATLRNHIEVYDIIHNSIMIGKIGLPPSSMATDIIISPDGSTLYISYNGKNGIIAADTKTLSQKANIEPPIMAIGQVGIPQAIAVNRDNSILYVALSWPSAGEVVAIDTRTGQPVARAPVGELPTGIALSPDGKKIYVTNYNSANVSVLTTNPLALAHSIPVGPNPARVVVTPDCSKVFVTCRASDAVYAISENTGKVLSSIKVGGEPMGIAVNGDGSRVYVANFEDNTVSIIDTNSCRVIKTTKPQVFSKPYGIAIKP